MASDMSNRESSLPEPSDMDPIEKVILRSMNEGVITVECTGHINTVNTAAARILGLDDQGIIGKKFDEIFPDFPESKSLERIVSRVVDEGLHTKNDEIRYRRTDGELVDLAVATSYLDFDVCSPGVESVVVVFRDVTAFKSIERARRKAADHLSHELKTPLSIIAASVELLARNPSKEKSAKILERIERNLARLIAVQTIVEQILYPPPYRPVSFDFGQRIQDVLAGIRDESAHRAVSVRTKVEEIHTGCVDPNVFDIILETLVKNAIENTPDHGEITISLHREESGVRLQVRDSGVGIPASDVPFIFDGFHHTQSTEDYSSKKPYYFDAGGKGLELLRLKVLSETYPFDIAFESTRCRHLPNRRNLCPGDVSRCVHVDDKEACRESGGTVFSVVFHELD
ncbi:MAG: PAS domain S-box protein [Desulfomonilaceae bacterium]|nr:PAS domain S-box protein [Desulfomonilaceae bacterium]